MAKSFAPLAAALYAATPFKSLAFFENYFALSAATSVTNRFRNRKLVWQLHFLTAAMLYFTALQVFQCYLPRTPSATEWHLLTFDVVYFFHLPSRCNLLLGMQSALIVYYIHIFYFWPNAPLNRLLEGVLFGRQAGFVKPKRQEILRVLPNFILGKKRNKRQRMFYRRALPLVAISAAPISEAVIPVALSSAAFFDLFTLGLNLVVVLGMVKFLALYWEHYFFSTDAPFWSFLTEPSMFQRKAALLLSTLPPFLLHASGQITVIYAYLVVVGFAACYAFVLLSYLHELLAENSRQLRSVLFEEHGNGSKNHCNWLRLNKVFHANLAIFRVLFHLDHFGGNAFFAFLLANFPSFAFCSMMVLFNRRLLEEDFLALFVLSGIVFYEIIGTLVVHVLFARLSRHLHSSAALLVSYSAKMGVKRNCQPFSFLKHQLTLWTHTMRLLTVRRYGITYGVVGSLVTMATFARVRNNEMY